MTTRTAVSTAAGYLVIDIADLLERVPAAIRWEVDETIGELGPAKALAAVLGDDLPEVVSAMPRAEQIVYRRLLRVMARRACIEEIEAIEADGEDPFEVDDALFDDRERHEVATARDNSDPDAGDYRRAEDSDAQAATDLADALNRLRASRRAAA